MKPGHGRADYLLYVDKAVVGVIEAKPEGTPLSGVEWQSAMYADGLPADVRLAALTEDGRLPFVFEASGHRDPLHQRFRPRAAGAADLRLPEAGDAGPHPPRRRGLARALRPGAAKVRDLPAARHRSPAAGADQGDQRHRAEPGRAAVRPSPGADGHRRGQDLHRRHRSPTGCSSTAASTGSCSSSTATTWPTRRWRSSRTTARRTTAAGSPRSTTSTKLTSAGLLGSTQGGDLDDPAGLQVRCSDEEVSDADDPGLDDFVPDSPGHGRPTAPHCRRRRSTW